MDDQKRGLSGSPARDGFKKLHKEICDASFYGCDLDFLCVAKTPPGIVAALDYKEPRDTISFSEVIAYNDLLARDIQVFIVQSSHKAGFDKFTIMKYLGGDFRPNPPLCKLEAVLENVPPHRYREWEARLRSDWIRKQKAKQEAQKPNPPMLTIVKTPAEQMLDWYAKSSLADIMELEPKFAEIRFQKFLALQKTGTEG